MPSGGYSQSCDILPEFRDKYAQNDVRVNHIHRHYTHTFTYTHIFGADQLYTSLFFAALRIWKIWHLEAIRRAVLFYMNFVINMPRTMTARIIYIDNIHTHIHTHTHTFYVPIKSSFMAIKTPPFELSKLLSLRITE